MGLWHGPTRPGAPGNASQNPSRCGRPDPLPNALALDRKLSARATVARDA